MLFDWITRLETELTIDNFKLENNLTDEEFNTRVQKQIEKLITERLIKNINLDKLN